MSGGVGYLLTFKLLNMNLLSWYFIISYAIIAGVLWEADSGEKWGKIFVWLLSPLFLPVYLGMVISKHYNK